MYIWLSSPHLLAPLDTVITCPCFREALICSLYRSSFLLLVAANSAMNTAWSGGKRDQMIRLTNLPPPQNYQVDKNVDGGCIPALG